MELQIVIQGKNDEPQLMSYVHPPLTDLTNRTRIMFCVIEEGMTSGEPSVIIGSAEDDGTVFLQTSLDKFLSGATAMATAAETHWGWKRPDGYYTLQPMSKEARKLMLEGIKKELEEWED